MTAVAHLIVHRPRAVLGVAFLLIVGAAYATTTLSLDNSTERLLVRDSENWRFLASVQEAFGGDETLFVLLREPDAVAPPAIRRLRAVTEAVAAVREVERVVSLTSLRWPWAEAGDVAVKTLFAPSGEPSPGAPLARALAHPLVAANLLSADHGTAAVLAMVSPHPEDPRFKGRLVAHVEAAVARAAPGAEVMLGGAPFAQVALNRSTARDLRSLGLVMIAVMAAVLFVVYRTAHGVWLPLATVLLALLCTIALAAVLGRSLSIVSSVLPPLVLAIGTSYTIRVLSEYDRQRAVARDRAAALVATLSEVGVTVLLCGATTAIGFAALLTSRVAVIRDLGLLAAAGSAFTTLAALTVVPAVLAVLPAGGAARRTPAVDPRLARALSWVHVLTVRRGGALLVGAGAVTLAGILGLRFLTVDQDPYAWFPRGSAVARSTAVIDERLGGVVPFGVVLESPAGGYDPALYRAADAVAAFARRQPEVGAVVSPADFLRLTDAAFRPGGEGGDVPAGRDLVAQYLLLYDLADPSTLAPYVDEESGRVQVLVRLGHATNSRLRAFVARLEGELPSLVPPPLRARVTGTGLLRLDTNDELTRGLFRQLLLASLAMGVVVALALRSVGLGALALVPNLLPILLLYGALGWLGIALNAATVTTGAAALGNALDDTVQYLDRYRRRRRAAASGEEARRQTLEAVGAPMIASDVVLVLGFSVLLFSSFFPVASLGLLGALAMGLSLLASLFVLPVLVALSGL